MPSLSAHKLLQSMKCQLTGTSNLLTLSENKNKVLSLSIPDRDLAQNDFSFRLPLKNCFSRLCYLNTTWIWIWCHQIKFLAISLHCRQPRLVLTTLLTEKLILLTEQSPFVDSKSPLFWDIFCWQIKWVVTFVPEKKFKVISLS